MTQDTEEKKRRSTTATRDEKTPVLPARHDTTGKLMMLDTATQTSSSDHFEESSRRYAEWEEEVRLEELQHLQRVAIRLFDFSMYSEFHTDVAQRHTSQGPHHVLGRVRCTEQGCSELIPLSWPAGKSAVAIQSVPLKLPSQGRSHAFRGLETSATNLTPNSLSWNDCQQGCE
ncbi:uncharacterized protein [Periplaneta americana]|uniref:uncharacterized protein n=1 Tax=Periplaneta americana TaxID=6978 RepID=UPI0037E750E8